MKKQIFLSIALLTSLAGCNKDKPQPKKLAQKVDVFSSVNIPLADNNDMNVQEDSAVLSFFDEDLGEFSFADEEDAEFNSTITAENGSTTDDYGSISWIDAAHESSDLKTVYFGFNKYGITADQEEVFKADLALLEELLEVIDEDALIVVEGHSCHSAGSAAYNMGLSEKRAKYIRDLLVSAGINPDRIRTVARGQEVPAMVDGKPVTGDRIQQASNRRVEIRIVEQA